MTQLQVGVPVVSGGSSATMVHSNYNADSTDTTEAFAKTANTNQHTGLLQPDGQRYTSSYAELFAQLPFNNIQGADALTDTTLTLQDIAVQPEPVEAQTDGSAVAEILSLIVSDTDAVQVIKTLPAVLPADTAEANTVVTDAPVPPEDSAAALIKPASPEDSAAMLIKQVQFAIGNIEPLPVSPQLRAEVTQPYTSLPAQNGREYSAALLNNSGYNNVKTPADTALPVIPVSLQHFIRQPAELVRPQSYDNNRVSGIAAMATTAAQPSVTTTVTEPAFQWKADQLGLQSSQWGQKLVHLLSDKINLQLGQHIQRAQIRLDPPQLGLIELSVSIDGDRTTVQLYASNNQMREAMQQNLDQLRQQLAQRMGSEQLLDIDVREQPQQQPGQQQGAASEHIAANFTDDVTGLTSTTAAQLTTGWLNRLV